MQGPPWILRSTLQSSQTPESWSLNTCLLKLYVQAVAALPIQLVRGGLGVNRHPAKSASKMKENGPKTRLVDPYAYGVKTEDKRVENELETDTLTHELDLLIPPLTRTAYQEASRASNTKPCRGDTDLFRYPIGFLVPLNWQIFWSYIYDQYRLSRKPVKLQSVAQSTNTYFKNSFEFKRPAQEYRSLSPKAMLFTFDIHSVRRATHPT